MHRYIARRLLWGAFAAVLVSLLIFALMRIAPGDVALMILTQGQTEVQVTEEQLQRVRGALGLSRPLHIQYFTWLKGMATGDWGTSILKGWPVWNEFKRKVGLTLQLGIYSLMLSLLLAIPAGILMALKQDTWLDYGLRVFTLAGLSIPNFWLGTMLMIAGLYLFEWNPRFEYMPFFKDPFGNLSQLFWPSLIVGYSAMATKARMLRSTMLEVLRQDYIRTARAKGLASFVVTYRHVLKNSLLPVVTVIGISVAHIVSGSVIMERVFSLPGIGNLLVEGMNQRDYTVVQALVMVFAVWTILANLLTDLTYGWLDPRIRYD